MDDPNFGRQVDALVRENRRLLLKSEADDKTIHMLKAQYDAIQAGMENMIEDHRRRERELLAEADRANVAYTEIEGHLNQAGDLIMQAARARIGNRTPERMPPQTGRHIEDPRLPIARLANG